MLLRMCSTEVAESEVHPVQARLKQREEGVPVQVSKKLAGKLTRLEQLRHALSNVLPFDTSISGKVVRLEQPLQAEEKKRPAEVFTG